MSLANQLASLTTTVATTFNTLWALIKTKAGINDSAASTTAVYSSAKVESVISARLAALVGNAPANLDTFYELAAQLQADESLLATLNAQLASRVRFDAAQALTAQQMAIVLANIGAVASADIGDPNTDLVAIFNNALQLT